MTDATIAENWEKFEELLLSTGYTEHIPALRHAFSFGVAITISRYCALFANAVPVGLEPGAVFVDLTEVQEEYNRFCSSWRRTLQ